jgi:hypothetical protein
MSIKGDFIAVGIAGVVLLAAGWYAKKKITGAVSGAGAAVVDAFTGIGDALKPAPNSTAREAINAPVHFIDGYINAAGQYITNDPNWSQQSWLYNIPKDFGVLNPNLGWDQ